MMDPTYNFDAKLTDLRLFHIGEHSRVSIFRFIRQPTALTGVLVLVRGKSKFSLFHLVCRIDLGIIFLSKKQNFVFLLGLLALAFFGGEEVDGLIFRICGPPVKMEGVCAVGVFDVDTFFVFGIVDLSQESRKSPKMELSWRVQF